VLTLAQRRCEQARAPRVMSAGRHGDANSEAAVAAPRRTKRAHAKPSDLAAEA
jgi:hypothetical protein